MNSADEFFHPHIMKKFISFITGLLLSFLLFSGVNWFVSAQDMAGAAGASGTGAPSPQPPSQENLLCIQRLDPFLEAQREDFLKFVDQNFKSTLANSNLIDAAITRYKNYRAILYKKYHEIVEINSGDATQVDRLEELNVCENRLQQEFVIAEQALRKHVRTTANSKRTIALVEKLQAINSRLAGMNINIGQMRGYFETMSKKVPFFVQKCLK